MSIRTSSAAILGLVGGIALGVVIGLEMTSARDALMATATRSVEANQPETVPVAPARVVVARKPKPAAPAVAAGMAPKLVMTIPVSAPALHERLKPVLARGTKIPMAADGFKDAELFATIAHASRNTQVPFILLKHRVLTEGRSLEQAIRASKPGIDAATEVERARTEAKTDLAALSATD